MSNQVLDQGCQNSSSHNGSDLEVPDDSATAFEAGPHFVSVSAAAVCFISILADILNTLSCLKLQGDSTNAAGDVCCTLWQGAAQTGIK